MSSVAFPKALQIMEKLLQGKRPKEVAIDEGVSVSTVTDVKKMFPLFLGLVQKRNHNADYC